MPSTPVKKPSRVSRKNQMKSSPVPWILLIIISVGIYFVFSFSQLNNWNNLKDEIKTFERENPIAAENVADLLVERDKAEEKFLEKAKPQIEIERQKLPSEFNTSKLIKILEIFSIHIKNTVRPGYIPIFELNSISIGAPSKDATIPGLQRTLVSISIETDQENLETLIEFLQTNEVPERLLKVKEQLKQRLEKDPSKTLEADIFDITLLEDDKLPIMYIDSISKSLANDPDYPGKLRVNLSVFFYHLIPTKDTETKDKKIIPETTK